jgi:hypothetical protein
VPNKVLPVAVEADFTIGIPFGVPVTVPFNVAYAGPVFALVAGACQISFQIGDYPSYGQIYLKQASIYSPGFAVYLAQ